MINWITNWFIKHCDGNWETSHRIKIETMDNPGWFVQIDVRDTELCGRHLEEIDLDRGDDDWIVCRVQDGIFEGLGDSRKLVDILRNFLAWNEQSLVEVDYAMIEWLEAWFIFHYIDEFFDYYCGITIETTSNRGWVVQIEVEETELENRPFNEIKNDADQNDWIKCMVHNGIFEGCGDAGKLNDILTIFRGWAEA